MKTKGNKRLFSRRKIIALSVILASVLIVGVVVVVLSPVVLFCCFSVFQTEKELRMQKQVLCKVDHQALLETCRVLSKQILTENPDLRDYMIVPDSVLSKYPVIRDIGANHVTVSRIGIVRIDMGSTMWHFGIFAYPDGINPSSSGFPHKELIPGLWYYDVRYDRYEDYDEDIERLLQKAKRKAE
jgi:hypothetical protein